MRMTEITYTDLVPVEGYGPGFFRLGGKAHEAPLAVLPNGIQPWKGYDDTDLIIAASDRIDVLFVGTGEELTHVPDVFRSTLEEAGIGVEPMASPTACRTYNVLLSEGRRIGLVLFGV